MSRGEEDKDQEESEEGVERRHDETSEGLTKGNKWLAV